MRRRVAIVMCWLLWVMAVCDCNYGGEVAQIEGCGSGYASRFVIFLLIPPIFSFGYSSRLNAKLASGIYILSNHSPPISLPF